MEQSTGPGQAAEAGAKSSNRGSGAARTSNNATKRKILAPPGLPQDLQCFFVSDNIKSVSVRHSEFSKLSRPPSAPLPTASLTFASWSAGSSCARFGRRNSSRKSAKPSEPQRSRRPTCPRWRSSLRWKQHPLAHSGRRERTRPRWFFRLHGQRETATVKLHPFTQQTFPTQWQLKAPHDEVTEKLTKDLLLKRIFEAENGKPMQEMGGVRYSGSLYQTQEKLAFSFSWETRASKRPGVLYGH